MKHGFIKVAAAAPEIRVADPMFNADAVIRAMDEHARLGVKVLVFPELTLTGATCGDLFYQNTLLAGAAAALEKVVKASEGKDMLVFVGLRSRRARRCMTRRPPCATANCSASCRPAAGRQALALPARCSTIFRSAPSARSISTCSSCSSTARSVS